MYVNTSDPACRTPEGIIVLSGSLVELAQQKIKAAGLEQVLLLITEDEATQPVGFIPQLRKFGAVSTKNILGSFTVAFSGKILGKLSEKQFLSVFWHEVGHIVNQHHENAKATFRGVLLSPKAEIEADNFAFENGARGRDMAYAICAIFPLTFWLDFLFSTKRWINIVRHW